MKSSNPVLGTAYGNRRGYASMNSVPQNTAVDTLEETFSAPAASSLRTGRMTMDDVVARTAMLFGTTILVGAAAWYFNFGGAALMVGFIGGLVTAMIGIFSKTIRTRSSRSI